MFQFIKKSKNRTCQLFSPVMGECIQLEKVKDAVFANGLMGKGVAFELEVGTIYAPCDAKVMVIPTTKHAIGLQTNNGVEILIHIGLDTVNLNGEGFECLVKLDDEVKKGDPLINVNCTLLKEKGYDLTTPMIITNSNDYDVIINDRYGSVSNGIDELILINNK